MRQEKQFGFPRFKKVGRYRSFVFPQFKSNPITGWQIKLPKIGKMPIVLHRAIPDGFVVKQVRVWIGFVARVGLTIKKLMRSIAANFVPNVGLMCLKT